MGAADFYPMATVLVPVLKPLTYQGRSYVRGQFVRMAATDALVRAQQGEVSLTRDAVVSSSSQLEAREVTAENETDAPVRKRRQYRRRDMTVEPAGE